MKKASLFCREDEDPVEIVDDEQVAQEVREVDAEPHHDTPTLAETLEQRFVCTRKQHFSFSLSRRPMERGGTHTGPT